MSSLSPVCAGSGSGLSLKSILIVVVDRIDGVIRRGRSDSGRGRGERPLLIRVGGWEVGVGAVHGHVTAAP